MGQECLGRDAVEKLRELEEMCERDFRKYGNLRSRLVSGNSPGSDGAVGIEQEHGAGGWR